MGIPLLLFFSLYYHVTARSRNRNRIRGRVRSRGRAAKDYETQSIKILVIPYSQVFVGSKKLNRLDNMQISGFENLMREIASKVAPSSVSIKSSVTKQNRIHKRRTRPRPNMPRIRRRPRVPRKSETKLNETVSEAPSSAPSISSAKNK